MATTRGRFGHRRATGSNLTALIASLMQQQRAAEDRVMFDAYQNGGLGLDGKPVTDSAMLAYMTKRRDMMTTDDPLWSEWNNRIIQLNFNIGESKIITDFRQGKATASAVADFYKHQLDLVPHDSQVWRDIAQKAAQWAKSAISGGGGGGGGGGGAVGSATKQLINALNAKLSPLLTARQNYEDIMASLAAAARANGLISGQNDTLANADPGALMAMLSGYTGATITLRDGTKWVVSVDAFQQLQGQHYNGLQAEIDARSKINAAAGRTLANNSTTALEKQLTDSQYLVSRYNSIDEWKIAEDIYYKWQRDLGATQGNPFAAQTATDNMLKSLSDLQIAMGQSTQQESPDLAGYIKNLIQTAATGQAPAGTSTGNKEGIFGASGQGSLLDGVAKDVSTVNAQVQAIQNGAAFYGQKEYGGPTVVIDQPPPVGNDGYSAQVLTFGGSTVAVWTKGQEITTHTILAPVVQANGKVQMQPLAADAQGNFLDPTTGKIVSWDTISANIKTGKWQWDNTATQHIGWEFSVADPSAPGGRLIYYGVYQPDGTLRYSLTNPFQGFTDASGFAYAQPQMGPNQTYTNWQVTQQVPGAAPGTTQNVPIATAADPGLFSVLAAQDAVAKNYASTIIKYPDLAQANTGGLTLEHAQQLAQSAMDTAAQIAKEQASQQQTPQSLLSAPPQLVPSGGRFGAPPQIEQPVIKVGAVPTLASVPSITYAPSDATYVPPLTTTSYSPTSGAAGAPLAIAPTSTTSTAPTSTYTTSMAGAPTILSPTISTSTQTTSLSAPSKTTTSAI